MQAQFHRQLWPTATDTSYQLAAPPSHQCKTGGSSISSWLPLIRVRQQALSQVQGAAGTAHLIGHNTPS